MSSVKSYNLTRWAVPREFQGQVMLIIALRVIIAASLAFFCFCLSVCGGSQRALGSGKSRRYYLNLACWSYRFSLTMILPLVQPPVALVTSSSTLFGERPRGKAGKPGFPHRCTLGTWWHWAAPTWHAGNWCQLNIGAGQRKLYLGLPWAKSRNTLSCFAIH